ncbi:hypothetical protein AB0I53_11235 [Saccharopolyspora sp. NPDC050389]|uniref:hypothetical protein n=1 Tax=Saccharopolyspora sp. NPDC050389 TaxID=3155516 RepID=UPI0033E12950
MAISIFSSIRQAGGHSAAARDLAIGPLEAGRTPDYAERDHLIGVDYPMPGNDSGAQSVPVPRWGWRGE